MQSHSDAYDTESFVMGNYGKEGGVRGAHPQGGILKMI